MPNTIVRTALRLGAPLVNRRAVAPRSPVVLLYHGVPARADGVEVDAAALERHVTYLQRRCVLIHPEEVHKDRRTFDKVRVLLTFDDGMRNNADVVAPILRRHGVPAMFFVSSRHAEPGQYLWFVYLRALEKYYPGDSVTFRGQTIDLTPARRAASMQALTKQLLDLTPHPSAIYRAIEQDLPRLEDFVSPEVIADRCAGMTRDQARRLATDPLFTVGVHTVDHPLLTRCEPAEAWCQLRDNKDWIEDLGGQPCRTMAYPSGDYNRGILAMNHRLGIEQGYAVVPQCRQDQPQEIPRIGIYDPSLEALALKVYWGNHLRAYGLRIG